MELNRAKHNRRGKGENGRRYDTLGSDAQQISKKALESNHKSK